MSWRQKRQRPLIRYARSGAETSTGSKPIGSELKVGSYSMEWLRQHAPGTAATPTCGEKLGLGPETHANPSK